MIQHLTRPSSDWIREVLNLLCAVAKYQIYFLSDDGKSVTTQAGAIGKRRAQPVLDLLSSTNDHFAPGAYGRTVERQFRELIRRRDDRRERFIRAVYPLFRGPARLKGELRLVARNAVLAGFRLLGIKFPYDLNG
ncbi:hypothetical protein [Variovorax sp. dw_954]|uniref:hypothetical protein n=1 Tax=Variovorax sp. dw_954 TaxID=2720078 RepID=UPI001BD6D654|nr:hypothetical protein [Variovorax sp. dw_954]